MTALLLTEWEKIRNYRAFWLMAILYLVVLFSAAIGLPELLSYMADKTNASLMMRLFTRLLLSFPDVWQNIAFFGGLRFAIKVLLAMLVLILISNEFTFLTVRSNIISGMSRSQFLKAKLSLVLALSLFSTLALFVAGLYLGFTNTSGITAGKVLGRMYYLAAHFAELFSYLVFAMMIGMLVRKTGFAIILLIVYIMIEPVIMYYVPDHLDKYLPLNAMNHLVWSVNTSQLVFRTPDFNFSLQQSISPADLLVCLLYTALFTGIIWLYLKKKDL